MEKESNEVLKVFGETLRTIRKERNLSQTDLAYICCLDRTYISGLERGKRNPTLKVIAEIANKLEVSITELVSKIGAAENE